MLHNTWSRHTCISQSDNFVLFIWLSLILSLSYHVVLLSGFDKTTTMCCWRRLSLARVHARTITSLVASTTTAMTNWNLRSAEGLGTRANLARLGATISARTRRWMSPAAASARCFVLGTRCCLNKCPWGLQSPTNQKSNSRNHWHVEHQKCVFVITKFAAEMKPGQLVLTVPSHGTTQLSTDRRRFRPIKLRAWTESNTKHHECFLEL